MEAWRGEIINLTGKDIVICNGLNQPVWVFWSRQPAVQVDCEVVYLGMLEGKFELAYDQIYGLRGLPVPQFGTNGQPRCFYLVTQRVVLGAYQLRRSLDDLLLPHQPVKLCKTHRRLAKLPEQATVMYRGLTPARYWHDLHSLHDHHQYE